MIVLVCGGREFNDRDLLFRTLDALDPRPTLIINGAYRGADWLASWYAQHRGIQYGEFPALWKHYFSAAGPRRNAAMLRLKPDLVVAFPGGKGTADMIAQAQAAGVNVLQVGETKDGTDA